MIVSRKGLLRKLRMIEPALAKNDLHPALTRFRFEGGKVLAANGSFSLSMPCSGVFDGLIPAILSKMLATSNAITAAIQSRNGEVEIRLADTVVTLPSPTADSVCPRIASGRPKQRAPSAFLSAIEHCLPALAHKSNATCHRGIALIPEGDSLWVCATDEASLRYACLRPSPIGLATRTTLQDDFCRQMVRLAQMSKSRRIDIERRIFSADDVLLQGVPTATENTFDFVGVIRRFVPNEAGLIPLPKGLASFLKRCSKVVTSYDECFGDRRVEIAVDGGIATITARSDRGDLIEHLAMPYHPNVCTKLLVSPLCEPCTWADRLLITTDAIIMKAGAHFFLTMPSTLTASA